MNHDIVTVGASAGGFEVLMQLASQLPADFDASLFVVLHLPPGHTSALPELLSKRGPLPARHPLHSEPIQRGTIYVAPPDMHLQINYGAIEVVRGPKTNNQRPAVDVLFRTAASAYSSRVIGVVLSGFLDCGTAGMMSIKSRGGISVVQDPATASAPEMPSSVIANVPVDHIVPPQELPDVLTRLVATPAAPTLEPTTVVQQLEGAKPGKPAEIVCPICEGALTEVQPGLFQHFRCHVGHAFSLEAMVNEQSAEMERTLWAAVRVLEESAALSRRIANHETGSGKEYFTEKADSQLQQAQYIRGIIEHGARLSPDDAPKAKPQR